jgi:hypothetical protein
MIGLKLEINGKTACSIKREDLEFLIAMLTWRSDDPIECHVRGISDTQDGKSEHVTWLVKKLKSGDVVTFRITDVEVSDEPAERSPVPPTAEA